LQQIIIKTNLNNIGIFIVKSEKTESPVTITL